MRYVIRIFCFRYEIAAKYGELKLKLKNKYEHDRAAYTQGKTEFIKAATKEARKDLGKIYLKHRR